MWWLARGRWRSRENREESSSCQHSCKHSRGISVLYTSSCILWFIYSINFTNVKHFPPPMLLLSLCWVNANPNECYCDSGVTENMKKCLKPIPLSILDNKVILMKAFWQKSSIMQVYNPLPSSPLVGWWTTISSDILHTLLTTNNFYTLLGTDLILDRNIGAIHPFLSMFPWRGHRGAGAYPSCLWLRGGTHPGQFTSYLQGNIHRQTTFTLTFTWGQFKVTNEPKPKCLSLNDERRPEYLKRPHAAKSTRRGFMYTHKWPYQ